MPIGLQTRSAFVSEEYPTLFHYTDAAGVRGIVENNELWATHYHYLNDFTELHASRDRILPTVLPEAKAFFAWWKGDPKLAPTLAAKSSSMKLRRSLMQCSGQQ